MNKKRSVFILLLVLFAIVTIPLYFLGFGLYQWGYNMTNREITQSMYTKTSYFMNNLENEIQRLKKIHHECLHDDRIYYYVNASSIMTNYEQIQSLLDIQKRLSVVYNSSAYIADVSLWIPKLGYMISATDGVNSTESGWEEILQAQTYNSESGMIYHNGELYLCAAYPANSHFSNTSPLYILAIRLSEDKISEELLSFNLYKGSGTLLANPDIAYSLLVGEDIGAQVQHPVTTESNERTVKNPVAYTITSNTHEKFLALSVSSHFLNMELHTYTPEKIIYGDLNRYRSLFIAFIAISGILVAAYFWFSNKIINRPIKRLVQALTKVEQGELTVQIEHDNNDEFSYLYEAFNQMVSSLHNMLEINYRQRLLTQEADFRQLQSQINPHFLHNSFFILYRMAKDEDYDNITEFLTYLSDYYRYITRNAQMDVELQAEDGHARRYVQIQLIRFKKRISVQFDALPESVSSLIVPRLILQPLLENAFNHGLKDIPEQGRVHIWYELKKETLLVHVEDNGIGLAPKEQARLEGTLRTPSSSKTERTGVVNIHQRLQAMFGKQYGLSISAPAKSGVRFTLTLPLINKTGKNAENKKTKTDKKGEH